jgi:arylsulfatase A-like enzyme
MDRLAAGGVRFRNAFITHSICSPGRAGFLTGQYTHTNGVMNNHTPFPESNITHASLLRDAGYQTAYFGKWHMGDQKARPGFQHYASFINQEIYQNCPFEINGTVYMKPLLEAGQSLEVAYSTNAVHLDYLRHIKGIDENLGRLLDALDQLQLAEDTVVVYTSDNGFYLGEHGLGDKRALYEEGLRIPFIIRYPRLFPKGKLNDDLVINQDLAPTFLDLAGLPAYPGMHGVSFKPLALGNKPVGWRSSFLCYYSKDLGPTPTCRGIRTESAKLIVYKDKPEWTSVYDLQNDPYELNSLPADGPLA